MTEQTGWISYLLNGLFSAIFWNEYNKKHSKYFSTSTHKRSFISRSCSLTWNEPGNMTEITRHSFFDNENVGPEPAINWQPITDQQITLKEYHFNESYTWAHNTVMWQQIAFFDSCQLTIIWMSTIKFCV